MKPNITKSQFTNVGIVLAVLAGFLAINWYVSNRSLPKAPVFSLPRIDAAHETLSLQDFQGKVFVMNFWASWCQVCKKEVNEWQELVALVRARQVPLLSVASFDSREAATKVKRWQVASESALLDADGSVSKSYAVNELPQTLVVDQNGRIVLRLRGPLTERSLKRIVAILDKAAT